MSSVPSPESARAFLEAGLPLIPEGLRQSPLMGQLVAVVGAYAAAVPMDWCDVHQSPYTVAEERCQTRWGIDNHYMNTEENWDETTPRVPPCVRSQVLVIPRGAETRPEVKSSAEPVSEGGDGTALRECGHEDLIAKIIDWSLAYPLSVFPEPDFDAIDPAIRTAVSASMGRHVIRQLLELIPEEGSDE